MSKTHGRRVDSAARGMYGSASPSDRSQSRLGGRLDARRGGWRVDETPVLGSSLRLLTLLLEHARQIESSVVLGGLECEGATQQLGCLVRPPVLRQKRPEARQRRRVIRLCFQDGLVLTARL